MVVTAVDPVERVAQPIGSINVAADRVATSAFVNHYCSALWMLLAV